MDASTSYSPRQFDKDTLERLFVNREAQLNIISNRISDAGNSGSLAHTLFVGERGAGKTHLILLAYYKAMESKGFGKRYTLSLLPEEPYGIVSFETLMETIYMNNEPSSIENPNNNIITIVFAENYDRILDALGFEGQKRLRAYLERNRNLLFAATAQRLPRDSFEQAAPFYGFFDTIRLSSFTAEEIARMLIRKAEIDGDNELAAQLTEQDTLARLAALVQVAGGLPRIWSIFSSGLGVENLPDMTGSMLEKLDQLIPLYQEMLWGLSPNERNAVSALIDADCAMTVKALAEQTKISQKSLATTLRILTPDWVIARKGSLMQFVDKRNTYYQLADPLVRIVIHNKNRNNAMAGRPVKTEVDFIAAWHMIDEFGRFPFAEKDAGLVRLCHSVDDALSTLQNKQSAEKILSLPTSIIDMIEAKIQKSSCACMRIELALLAVSSGGENEWLHRAIAAISAIENDFSLRPEEEKTAQLIVSFIRVLLGQYEAGLHALNSALCLGGYGLTNKQKVFVSAMMEHSRDGSFCVPL